MTTRTTTFQRTFGITCAFAFATAICGLLLGARRCFAEGFDVGGLFGNLLLAWIPYILALAGCAMLERGVQRRSGSPPLSQSAPSRANGSHFSISSICSQVLCWPRLASARRVDVHHIEHSKMQIIERAAAHRDGVHLPLFGFIK